MNKAYDFQTEGPTTDVVATPDQLRPMVAEWDALCARDPLCGMFLSPRWLIPALLARPGKWILVTARDATGRLVGLLPLWRRRYRHRETGARRVELDAAGRLVWSEYSGFVCDPVAEGEALDAMAAAVRRLDWTEFALPYVDQPGRPERFAAGFDPRQFAVGWPPLKVQGGAVDSHKCPRVALPREYDTYLDTTLDASTRRKMRRIQRKYIESGDLRIEDAAKGDGFDTVLDYALTQWQGHGREPDSRGARYDAMLRMARAQGLLTVPALFDGTRLLGALFNIADARTGYELHKLAARDPEPSDVPIGMLLHGHAIRTAIQRGRLVYDFGHGDEPYKHGFGAKDAITRSLFIARARVK